MGERIACQEHTEADHVILKVLCGRSMSCAAYSTHRDCKYVTSRSRFQLVNETSPHNTRLVVCRQTLDRQISAPKHGYPLEAGPSRSMKEHLTSS